MDAYDTLPDAWPWSTWADDPEPFYYPGDPVDSDKAAWRKLLVLAQERGLASHIMGENTGGGGVAAIDQLATGALRAGYRGIFYLDYPTLSANGGLLLGALVSTFDEQLALAGYDLKRASRWLRRCPGTTCAAARRSSRSRAHAGSGR